MNRECLLDTKRNVVLSIESRYEGMKTATQQFGDFTQVAGAWWAGPSNRWTKKAALRT